MSLPVTVAMPPSLEKVHPLPVGMIVAGCRRPPIAAQLEALDDLQEAAMGRVQCNKTTHQRHAHQEPIRLDATLTNQSIRAHNKTLSENRGISGSCNSAGVF